jgi:hypothetical protein
MNKNRQGDPVEHFSYEQAGEGNEMVLPWTEQMKVKYVMLCL